MKSTFPLPTLALLAASGATAILAASGAMAQSFPPGVESRGWAELGYIVDEDGFDETYIEGDFDIMVGAEALGMGAPIGFDVGLHGIWVDGNDLKVLYGALTYDFGQYGKLSVGVPRSAYESFVRSQHTDAFGLIGDLPNAASFASQSFMIGAFLEESPFGLRYDNSFGEVTVAASYSEVDLGGADASFLGLGASYSIDAWTLALAAETIDLAGSDFTNVKLGAGADYGQYAFGLNYTANDFVFPFGADLDAVEAYGIYRPSDKIDLTASLVNLSLGPSSYDIYGLAAKYRFAAGAYGEIGAMSLDGDERYHIALGWQF